MKKYCLLNGKVLPQARAGLALNDLGILRGYGVFEILRTYNGKPLHPREHLKRLKNSAKLLDLKLSFSEKLIADQIGLLLKKNKFSGGKPSEAVIRIVLTGGQSEDSISYTRPSFFITLSELKKLPSEFYQKGVSLITLEHKREIPEAKTINYITALKMKNLFKGDGIYEPLFVSGGSILEGGTSNFFVFKNNTLITPKENVLAGITRDAVLKLAKKKFRVQLRDLKQEEMTQADESFVTGTTKEIVPVVRINNRLIGGGKVGRKTKYLMELFHNYAQVRSGKIQRRS